MLKKTLFFILFFLFYSFEVFPSEKFLPKNQEERAQNLFLQVKCPVCEGQVIENSSTEIAFEMRKLIREKISQGKTDDEIKNYLIKNYGSEILTSPPLNSQTLLLWILPITFLALGFIYLLIFIKKRKLNYTISH